MLGTLMKPYRSIAVAGSHGKTSTTSIIASVFNAAGLSPTYVVGGQVLSVGRSSNLGDGSYMIVEADESDGSFLHLQPEIAVITNIDNDHLAFYDSNQDKLNQAFVSFAENLPFYGHLIITLDDSNVSKIAKHIHRKKITFGFSPRNQFQIINVELLKGVQKFQLLDTNTKKLYSFSTSLSGKHNIYNLCAAICVALEEKISIADIKKGLKNFKGVGRRFEIEQIAISNQPKILIDDYGHHPSEVRATLNAARAAFPGQRIVMVFQPHRFSRTRDFYEDFVAVLSDCDLLVLLDVYSAGEDHIAGADARSLARSIRQRGAIDPVFAPDIKSVPAVLCDVLEPGDLLLTQGAGNIGQLARQLAEADCLEVLL